MTSLQNPPRSLPDHPDLQIHVTTVPDRTTVTLLGELDLETAPLLTAAVEQVVADRHTRIVVVQMSGITFCDVRGLTALLGAHHRIHRDGGRLTVTGVSNLVRRMAAVSRLHTVMNLA